MNSYAFRVLGAKKAGKTAITDQTMHDLVEDSNLFTGRANIEDAFGPLTTMELDLLRFASSILAVDRASRRGTLENLTRAIAVQVPVEDLNFFLPLAGEFQSLLRELSQDIWVLNFVPRASTSEEILSPEMPMKKLGGKTLLFSGGLDSLAAAVEYSNSKDELILVSHKTRNPATDNAQKHLVDLLEASGRKIVHTQVFVSSRDGGPTNLEHDVEPSQRTRSFVFLTLGAICARRTGFHDVVILAENGQLAIHLPLTSARIGAFSTRTAHPAVLLAAESLLGNALDFSLKITNPYLYKTKAEVVLPIVQQLPAAVPISTSCWKNARLAGLGVTHCGECVPCIMRRIALETSGPDPTSYARDAFALAVAKLQPTDDARRNLYDVAEFVERFAKTSADELLWEFPDLMTDPLDATAAIAMYKRFAFEARAIFGKYAGLASLLK